MKSLIVRKAFLKSLPVMAGYIVLGIGFGILLGNAGYGVVWSAAMAVFIYAGSMQYVGVSLLAGHRDGKCPPPFLQYLHDRAL